VAGQTESFDFPTTPGAYDQTRSGNYDAFVAKFSATGDSLLGSTFLGGASYEEGISLVLDLSGNSVVMGYTSSSDFPTTPGAYDQTFNEVLDVFVTKLSALGDSLLWSTFLGGSDSELGFSLVLDLSGNPIVVGPTKSSDFPTTLGSYDQTLNGLWDVFVTKLSALGDSLLWSTFLGGSYYDCVYSLVLDPSGNPIVVGSTESSDFPTTPGAYDQTFNGLLDVFVTKLSALGDSLLWSTFVGGIYGDEGFSLVLDLSENPVVTGYTYSSNFPTTPGAYDQTLNGLWDVFVTKLSALGDSLLWSTFLGGSYYDRGYSLVLDPSGNPIVVGSTESSDFPTTPGAYDQTFNGLWDVFVTKLSALGDSLLGSTFLGGSGYDYGQSLVVDPSGNPVVTGHTESSDFPTTPGAYDRTLNGYADVFVVKFEIRTEVELEEHVIGLPETFKLRQSYPNPFNASAEIRYQIPERNHVTLEVFNILGQRVQALVDGNQEAGEYSVLWNGRDSHGTEVSTGIYFCTMRAGEFYQTRKMVLIR
jgi:hypothetical protein